MTRNSQPSNPETPPTPRSGRLLRAVRVPRSPEADAIALRQTHIGLVTAEQHMQDLLYGISAHGVRGCHGSHVARIQATGPDAGHPGCTV
ncbi:MAG: hypothetical protein V4510_06245 [bacterium]